MRRILLLVAVVALLAASSAQAGIIKGEGWLVPGGTISPAAFTALGPTADPDITFSVDYFGFDSRNIPGGDPQTVRNFLLTSGAQEIFALTTDGTTMLGQAPSQDHLTPNAFATYYRFRGSAFFQHDRVYNFVKDDGFKLYVDGSLFWDASPATEPQSVSKQWLGADGIYSFELLYGEWNSTPAVLVGNLQAVPEPASLLLLGTGLLGAVRAARRRRA